MGFQKVDPLRNVVKLDSRTEIIDRDETYVVSSDQLCPIRQPNFTIANFFLTATKAALKHSWHSQFDNRSTEHCIIP
jgi:hypothetical protein